MEISDREPMKTITIKGILTERSFWEVRIYHSNSLGAYVLHITTNVIDEEVCDEACLAIATLIAERLLKKGRVIRMAPCTEAPARGGMPMSEAFFIVFRVFA